MTRRASLVFIAIFILGAAHANDFAVSSSAETCANPAEAPRRWMTAAECEAFANSDAAYTTFVDRGAVTTAPAGCSVALDGTTVQYNSNLVDTPGGCSGSFVSGCVCRQLVKVTGELKCQSSCYTHLFMDALWGGGRRQIRPSPVNGEIVANRRFLLHRRTSAPDTDFSPGGRIHDVFLQTTSMSWRFAWLMANGNYGYLYEDSENLAVLHNNIQSWELYAESVNATGGFYMRSWAQQRCLSITSPYSSYDYGGSLENRTTVNTEVQECNFNSVEQTWRRVCECPSPSLPPALPPALPPKHWACDEVDVILNTRSALDCSLHTQTNLGDAYSTTQTGTNCQCNKIGLLFAEYGISASEMTQQICEGYYKTMGGTAVLNYGKVRPCEWIPNYQGTSDPNEWCRTVAVADAPTCSPSPPPPRLPPPLTPPLSPPLSPPLPPPSPSPPLTPVFPPVQPMAVTNASSGCVEHLTQDECAALAAPSGLDAVGAYLEIPAGCTSFSTVEGQPERGFIYNTIVTPTYITCATPDALWSSEPFVCHCARQHPPPSLPPSLPPSPAPSPQIPNKLLPVTPSDPDTFDSDKDSITRDDAATCSAALSQPGCASWAAANGFTFSGTVMSGDVPTGCYRVNAASGGNVVFNTNAASTAMCNVANVEYCICARYKAWMLPNDRCIGRNGLGAYPYVSRSAANQVCLDHGCTGLADSTMLDEPEFSWQKPDGVYSNGGSRCYAGWYLRYHTAGTNDNTGIYWMGPGTTDPGCGGSPGYHSWTSSVGGAACVGCPLDLAICS
jgi:hypothetical protein